MNIKLYTRRDLAMAYVPGVCPRSAVNRLGTWIRHNTKLYEELKRTTHYRDGSRFLTGPQVELLFEYLGEP